MLGPGKLRGFLILAFMINFAISERAERDVPTRSPSSRKPKLFAVYNSIEGLILDCIGLKENSNLTWYWRRRGDETIFKLEQNDLAYKINYWMLFGNQLRATSRLEMRGRTVFIYNNTDIICSSDGNQAAYRFSSGDLTNDGNIPSEYENADKLEDRGSKSQTPSTNNGRGIRLVREEAISSIMSEAKATVIFGNYPRVIGPSKTTLYLWDALALKCEYTSPDSPVTWNLEFPNKRDEYMASTDFQVRKNNASVFVSVLFIPAVQPEHNNTKVICENKEGRAEYSISLSYKRELSKRRSSSNKPKLFSLYESDDGLILICIGVNEKNNITWFWRNKDVNEPVFENKHENFIRNKYGNQVSKTNYWMLFQNQLKTASRLEMRGPMLQIFNNTDFICFNDGPQTEYRYIFKTYTDTISKRELSKRQPSSKKPKLFSLYESDDGLILICIGVNEKNNITWFWRNKDVNEPVFENKHENFIRNKYGNQVSKTNYWMLFQNQLKTASRLEVRGPMLQLYNNTDFICFNDGPPSEYRYIFKNNTDTILKNIPPVNYNADVLEATSPSDGSKSQIPAIKIKGGLHLVRAMKMSDTEFSRPASAKYRHSLRMIGPSMPVLYVGDELAFKCEYTSHDSTVAWHLEFPNHGNDTDLMPTIQYVKSAVTFVSVLIIPSIGLEHNNTRVICANKDGRDEYNILLRQKKRLHESCENRLDCLDVNAQCQHGECSCEPPFYCEYGPNSWYICMKIKKYNERCDYNVQCGAWETEMRCEYERCRCAQGFTYNGDRCISARRRLGEQCYGDDDCDFTYGTCRNVTLAFKACACQDGFRPAGAKCISLHVQAEERMLAVCFLTAIVILAVLAMILIVFALKSARRLYLQRKARRYREVIIADQQLSIASRGARNAHVVTQEKACCPSDVAFTTIHRTPSAERGEVKPAEDKTVCVPETIPFINEDHSSVC